MSTEHFVPADAIEGVKGSKPRFKSAREELPSLNREYLESRNAKLKAQAFLAQAQAQEKSGELLSKALVTRQAQYILICLRQAILNFPTRYARHVMGVTDEHQAKAVLTKAAHEFLTELAGFPEKAIDPGWLVPSKPMGEARRAASLAHRAAMRLSMSRSGPSADTRPRPRQCASSAPQDASGPWRKSPPTY